MLSEEKVAPCFVTQTMIHSSRCRTISILPVSLFAPHICGRNLILSCLTGSHMTISSKSNYCIRLNADMNIADSNLFYFNFGKGHYVVLWVKQHIFGKVQIFQMNRVNPATINWRERKVETCARRSTSFENFPGKTKYVR